VTSVCFYFQVHQPHRLRRYTFFDIGKSDEYLDDVENRRILKRVAEREGWSVIFPGEFSGDYLEHLASSHVFLSGYGQSFYEAATLGTYPVVWPLSQIHLDDALVFYDSLGIGKKVVTCEEELAGVIAPLLAGRGDPLPPLRDGTPKIVETLRALCLHGGAQ